MAVKTLAYTRQILFQIYENLHYPSLQLAPFLALLAEIFPPNFKAITSTLLHEPLNTEYRYNICFLIAIGFL
jgi:hypothetical protein